MGSQKETIKTSLRLCLKVVKMYEWLLDLYVLDFFVDNHWSKLPQLWQETFQNMDPQDLGDFITGKHTKNMLPLSFLALSKAISSLCITREGLYEENHIEPQRHREKKNYRQDSAVNSCGTNPKLKNLFLKHVKLKKRHEISVMADFVYHTAMLSNCKGVLDFGSGLGHLVRMLAYKYNLSTIGIEMQTQLSEEARKLDLELEYTAKKHLSEECMSKLIQPVHHNTTLSSLDQLNELLLPETMRDYGLIGLHPCGDLGPLLIKHFVNSENVKFICVVGCCYMKLSPESGYPMSDYGKSLDSSLSYVSREIACHAIETYTQRLCKGDYKYLKVHAYRAALEKLLVQTDIKLKHMPVRSVKHTHNMSFESYCTAALEKISFDSLPVETVEDDLKRWKQVVVLYTLRLMLAPLVETVILLDRMLYILEHCISCSIYPVFDPKISPRNHIIVGRKLA